MIELTYTLKIFRNKQRKNNSEASLLIMTPTNRLLFIAVYTKLPNLHLLA